VLTKLYKPRQGLRFSGYNGQRFSNGGNPPLYASNTGIVLADYLEAQHDFAEADGPTAATVTFINARRTVGNQPALSLTPGVDDAAIMAALRDQRGRDLLLGGFRLGDLRRWKRHGVGDFFPSGDHVNTAVSPSTWPGYQDATCYPIPQPELQANPNEAIRSFVPTSKEP
jgi:hypothetical protein